MNPRVDVFLWRKFGQNMFFFAKNGNSWKKDNYLDKHPYIYIYIYIYIYSFIYRYTIYIYTHSYTHITDLFFNKVSEGYKWPETHGCKYLLQAFLGGFFMFGSQWLCYLVHIIVQLWNRLQVSLTWKMNQFWQCFALKSVDGQNHLVALVSRILLYTFNNSFEEDNHLPNHHFLVPS